MSEVVAAAPPVADAPIIPAVDAGASTGAPAVVSDPAAPVAPVTPAAPVEYALKLPDAPTLNTASLERTVAFARAQGLSPEVAQAALELANTEAKTAVEAAQQSLQEAFSPGDPAKGIAPGAEWKKQHDTFLSASLADPELGAGDQQKLDAAMGLAGRAYAKYATPEFSELLAISGYGSHPAVVRVFAAIGKAMGEAPLVVAGAQGGERSLADIFYSSEK
jgi:hypothetical protein